MDGTGPKKTGIRFGNSVFWASSSSALAKVVDVLALFLLTRLLEPESFGLVAMALLVINGLEILLDFGVGQALVHKSTIDDEAAETALRIIPAVGLVLYVASFLVSRAAASFFNSPELTNVIRALSFVLVLQSLGAVPNALLERKLMYRNMVAAEALSSLCYLLVSASLAYMGWTVWSLVWGKLARGFVRCVVMWLSAGWRPAGKFNSKAAKELYSFGRHIVVLGLLSFILKNLDNAVIGRYLSPADLGLYTVAYSVGNFLPTFVKMTLGRVAFPYYSRVRENPEDLREKFLTINRANVILCVWVTLMLAGVFPLVAGEILGSRWGEVGPLVQILAFFGLQRSIASVGAPILNALGVPQAQREPMLLNALIFVPLAVPAAKMGGARAIAILATVSIIPGFIWTMRRVFSLLRIRDELPRFLLPCALGITCFALQQSLSEYVTVEGYGRAMFAAASSTVFFFLLIRVFEPTSLSNLGVFGRMLVETS
ncbi:lipopolysaccharide biosynthesis protein [Candidatus Poribacteria bacterium]|nr:lipopolysaccharide biosynthesis protein [Candidatus Poribacteria bacterium]